METEIPPFVKKSVRAVLLSKIGGVLVSQFAKDYKALVQQPLPFEKLGYDNMEDFFKAMPDVVKLEYCKKDMAYRLFGIGDAETYMSSWAKKSQNPDELSPKSRRRNNRHKNDRPLNNSSGMSHTVDDNGPQLDDNNRYSVMYPRKKTPNFTDEDVKKKFKDTGDIVTVHIIERWIFVRYWKREEAIKAYDMFKDELDIRYPSNTDKKGGANKSLNSNSMSKSDFGSSFGTSFGGSFSGGGLASTSFGGASVGSRAEVPENKKKQADDVNKRKNGVKCEGKYYIKSALFLPGKPDVTLKLVNKRPEVYDFAYNQT